MIRVVRQLDGQVAWLTGGRPAHRTARPGDSRYSAGTR
jgi:hypothetical protein